MVRYCRPRSCWYLVWILALLTASSLGFGQATSDHSTKAVNHAARSQAAIAARRSIPSRKTPAPLLGPVIYDNGPANGTVTGWQINFGFAVSDSFVVGSGATIGGLSFAAWLVPLDTLSTVDVSITSAPFGGTTYFSQTVNFSQSGCTSNQFNFDVCTETASFAGPNLLAGTYWVNLQNATVPSGDGVYWDQNAGAGCQSKGCPSMASENQIGTIPSEAFDVFSAPGISTTTLTVTPSSASAGEMVSLTSAVVDQSNQPITAGTVTFLSGAQVLGTVQLVQSDQAAGTATLKTRFGPGVFTLTAQYNGTNRFLPSTSPPQPLTVTGTEPTLTTLTAQPDGSNYDFTDSVFGFGFPPPTGSATVNDLTLGGFLLGNIGLAAPGQSSFLGGTNFAAGALPYLLTTGDFNGDGIPDLAVSNGEVSGQTVNVMLGNGDGTFQSPVPYQVLDGPMGIASGDFNADGKLDLAVACFTRPNQGVSVLVGNGDGSFQAQQPYPIGIAPIAVAVGDFNSDGAPDLAVADAGGTVIVLLNNGDGTFTPEQQTFPAGEEPMAIVVGDFNRDGNLDLAVADHFSQVQVLLGNGDGTFQPAKAYDTGRFPFGIAVGDLNGDGILDLAVTNSQDATVSVLLGNGDGSFTTLPPIDTGTAPAGIVIADLNNDGFQDLAVSTGISNGETVTVFLGNGDGTFRPPQRYPLPSGGEPVGLVTADFSGDGVPDLAAANVVQAAVAIFLGGTVTTGQLINTPVPGSGNQNIQSTYTPNTNFYTGSLSNTVVVKGNGQIPTTTTVTSSVNPSSYLQPVTFTATITDNSGSPTGTVNFTDNSTPIQDCTAVPLVPIQNGGTASCLTASLAVGSHNIQASYSGDGNFAPSTGTLKPSQQVNPATTQTVLTAVPPGQSNYLQLVTFTATVTGAFGGSPTGTVDFTDNQMPIPGCTGVQLAQQANGSTATCQTATLAVGSHTIATNYDGDNNFTGSSGSIPYTVVAAGATTTTLSVSPPSPVLAGQVVTLTATVGNGDLVTAGTVTFFSGTQALGTVQLVQSGQAMGTATLRTRFAPGTYTLTARFNGTNFNAPSQSQPQQYTVTGTEPTMTTLTATPDGSSYDFTDSVFGFGFPPLAGAGSLNDLTQGGINLGNIGLTGPGMSTFQPQVPYGTGASPVAAATGDFNGDGILDLAICNVGDNSVSVLLGNADGTFQPQQAYRVGAGPFGIAEADFNGDGIADLVVVNNGDDTVSVLLGNGDGSFQSQQPLQVGGSPFEVVVSDFNADGFADIAVANQSGSVSVLLGIGNGSFLPQQTYPVGAAPFGVTAADFNGDGIADLAVTNTGDNTVGVLLGKGDGTFQPQQPYQVGSGPAEVAAVDFNGDGIIDLAVTNAFDSTVSVLLGKGDGTFQPQQPYAAAPTSFGIAIADFNGDGIADLAVSSVSTDMVSVLLGKKDGTFQPQQTYTAGFASYFVTAVDFNGDGVPDLAVADLNANTVNILLGGTVTTGQIKQVAVPGTGYQDIQSTFTPDGNLYAGSLSNIVRVLPPQRPTTTQLASSLNPSRLSQPVTFTATVAASDESIPSGLVTFQSNGVNIPDCPNPANLVNGVASCTTQSLAAGNDTILASFNDPQGFYGSSSAMLVQQVGVSDFTLLPISPGSVTVTQGYNNTNDPFFAQTINLTAQPLSGYNGTVSLSCSVNPALAGGSCVVNPPSSGSLAGGNLNTTLTISAGSTTPIGAYTVTVTAQDNTGLLHLATLALTVINNAPGITMLPGGAGTTDGTLTGSPGTMVGNFSCPLVAGTGITGSEDLTKIGGVCTFSQGVVTLPGTFTVTISGCTVARLRTRTRILATLWLAWPAVLLLGWGRIRRLPRKRLLQVVATMLLFLALLMGVGCGGGYGQLSPTGMYSVLVQGTGPDGMKYSAVVPVTITPLK